jgi:RNA polymerase sigma factor (sigma-70 family)
VGRPLLRAEAAVDPLEEPVRRYLLTGDEGALDLVVRETRLRLLAAAGRIGDAQDAEDAVQSAYLSLVRKRGTALGAPVFPWLLTAVIRIAYRRKALARREEALARRLARPLPGPSPFTLAAGREIEERIGRAVERLPASYRDPVVLHYLSGLSTPETARLLDLPEATVRTRLRRARLLLRSRVPAGLLQAVLVATWFLKDALHGGGSTAGPAALGGLVMKAGGVVAIAIVAVAVGVAAGAKLLGGPQQPPGPPPEVVAAKARAERESLEKSFEQSHEKALRAVEAQRDEAKRQAEQAKQEAANARKETEQAKAALAAAAPEGGSAGTGEGGRPAPKPSSAPRFALGEYEGVLKELDWSKIGASMKSMVPLLRDLVDAARQGKPADVKALGRIQQLNAPLLEAALSIGDRIPGSGINAKFTHPVFASNAIASALDAAGLPLTDTEAEVLGRTAQEFTDKDRARTAGYDDRTWELQKVIDEAELRDSFFDAAFAALTQEQRDALRPESSKGYLGLDLFSSGLLWQQHLLPVFAPDKAGAIRAVQAQAVSFLGVPEERRTDLAPFIQDWIDAVPTTWLDGTEKLFGQVLHKTSHIEQCARAQLAVMRRIAENPVFGDGVAAKARKVGAVVFPVKQ